MRFLDTSSLNWRDAELAQLMTSGCSFLIESSIEQCKFLIIIIARFSHYSYSKIYINTFILLAPCLFKDMRSLNCFRYSRLISNMICIQKYLQIWLNELLFFCGWRQWKFHYCVDNAIQRSALATAIALWGQIEKEIWTPNMSRHYVDVCVITRTTVQYILYGILYIYIYGIDMDIYSCIYLLRCPHSFSQSLIVSLLPSAAAVCEHCLNANRSIIERSQLAHWRMADWAIGEVVYRPRSLITFRIRSDHIGQCRAEKLTLGMSFESFDMLNISWSIR